LYSSHQVLFLRIVLVHARANIVDNYKIFPLF
jgi:hypothetical protein